jgi:hypothetical protein
MIAVNAIKVLSGLFLLRGDCRVGARPDKRSISGVYKCHRTDADPANVPSPHAGNPLPAADSRAFGVSQPRTNSASGRYNASTSAGHA